MKLERVVNDEVRFPQDDEKNRLLHVCPTGCGCQSVRPVEWEEPCYMEESERVLATLECPNCDLLVEGLFSDVEFERLEDRIHEDKVAMRDAYQTQRRENIEDEVAKLAAALASDLIVPADF